MSEESTIHQISFVREGSLTTIDFLCTPSHGQELLARLAPVLSDEVVDFQVYQPCDVSDSGAEALVNQLCDDIDMDKQTREEAAVLDALETARVIDAGISRGGALGVATLEFVWDNGGDEDNAFGQSFAVREEDRHLLPELCRHLSQGMAGWALDMAIVNPAESVPLPDADAAVRELVTALDRWYCLYHW